MKKNVLTHIIIALAASVHAIHASVVSIKNVDDFKSALESDTPAVVIFSAQWCGACNGLKQPLQKVIDNPEFEAINFIDVDVDANEDLAKEQKISSIPTIRFMKGGIKKQEIIGLPNNTEKTLSDAIRKAFTQSPQGAAESTASQSQEEPQPASENFFTPFFDALMSFFISIKDMFMIIIEKIKNLFS